MSDDEADPELLELLRQSLGLSTRAKDEISSDTGVLKDAEYIYDNAIDVSIDMYGTKAAAASIYSSMMERGYSTQTWSQVELHPTREQGFSDVGIVNFVFTVDLLNFSFWSERSESERFQVEYEGKRWTGYSSLLACLRRAMDEGIPITTPRFWTDPTCSNEMLKRVFRSATDEEMPLLEQRIKILREAGAVLHETFGDPDSELEEDDLDFLDHATVLDNNGHINGVESDQSTDLKSKTPSTSEAEVPHTQNGHLDAAAAMIENGAGIHEEKVLVEEPAAEKLQAEESIPLNTNDNPAPSTKASSKPDMSVVRLIEKANHSAGKLVNLLVEYFPSFRDETRFNGRKVRFLKRAQIFVADVWAAFNGTSYGEFDDIGHLTMFADYRVPQMLRSLGVLIYSPPLDYAVRDKKDIPSGHSWEVQLRGCSIWAVELIRREIMRQNPAALQVNAVLIDFFLYDLSKEREASGKSLAESHLVSSTKTAETSVGHLVRVKHRLEVKRAVQSVRRASINLPSPQSSHLVKDRRSGCASTYPHHHTRTVFY